MGRGPTTEAELLLHPLCNCCCCRECVWAQDAGCVLPLAPAGHTQEAPHRCLLRDVVCRCFIMCVLALLLKLAQHPVQLCCPPLIEYSSGG